MEHFQNKKELVEFIVRNKVIPAELAAGLRQSHRARAAHQFERDRPGAIFTVSLPLLQHRQISRLRLSNRRERNAGVERDEPSFILNGKGKKIDVGKLPWAVNPRRVNNVRIQQADFVWPKLMDIRLACVRKTLHDSLDRQGIRIALVRHDPDTPVLSDRTGSPAFPRVLCEPIHCDAVRRVIGVE